MRERGVRGSLGRVPASLYWRYRHWADHARWDRRWGVDTLGSDRAYLSELPAEDVAHAEHYEAVGWQTFRTMIRDLGIVPGDHTFVDLGSGKGRALFFAAALGFRRVIGVEFSERMHQAASRNRERFQRSAPAAAPIELVHGDAAAFEPPGGPLCVFLYNPFRGPVMQRVVSRLATHADVSGAPVHVGYVNPKCAEIFEAHPDARRIHRRPPVRGLFDRRDAYDVYRLHRVTG